MQRISRKTRLLLLSLPAALLVAAVLFAFVRAQRTLTHLAASASTAHRLGFLRRPLTLDHPASALIPVAAPNPYTTGAMLDGNLYLGGPAGLTILASDGTVRRTLRTGLELPVAPITHIAIGRLRGAAEPQVLVSTAGSGLLILNPAGATPTVEQVLPATPELADLTTLQPLATGDLLLGTRRHGALLFSGSTLAQVTFTLPGIDPATLQVTALAAPTSTSFLIGTRNAGVFYSAGGIVQQAQGLPDQQVEAIATTASTAYVGTPLGTAELSLTSVHVSQTLAPGRFAHALALGEGQLTIGTLDQGIEQVPLGPASARPRIRNASLSLDPASTQRIDSFLSPSLALADGTLLRHTTSGWTPLALPASGTLTDRNISALAFDPAGRLYIGFFDHGLDILTDGRVQHLESDSLFCINRLALDPRRHTIAAATANGLVLFDPQGLPRQTLTRRDGLISDHITDVAFTRTGTALATPAGITFLTPTGAQSVYAFQGLVNNHVYALSSDPATDALVAGTLGGLSALEAQSIRRNFTATNSGLKHNWITALTRTPAGDTLVGTYGAGLERLSPQGIFTPIDLPAKDLVINPNALLATPTHLYAGTLGHGMLVYTVASNRWAVVANGLPSLNVTAFAVHAGDLYIGTENGLVRIPEASL